MNVEKLAMIGHARAVHDAACGVPLSTAIRITSRNGGAVSGT